MKHTTCTTYLLFRKFRFPFFFTIFFGVAFFFGADFFGFVFRNGFFVLFRPVFFTAGLRIGFAEATGFRALISVAMRLRALPALNHLIWFSLNV
jgi:hypothetical protein